jgi:glucose/arabinose dehydrogenase
MSAYADLGGLVMHRLPYSILLVALSLTLIQCQSSSHQNDAIRGLASSRLTLDKGGYAYDPNDRSCDGFPRLMVETMPGTCLGLVIGRDRANDAAADKSFIKPRTIVQIPGSREFMVADMGGWNPGNGRLFLLKPGASGNYELKLLKFPLNSPHGLQLGPDGFFYLGEKDKISRFHYQAGAAQPLTDWQLVIGGLKSFEGHMHPLAQFAFDPRSMDLFINSGAPSDHCTVEGQGDYKTCTDDQARGMGAILRIPGNRLQNVPKGGISFYEIAASGLRNSIAMAVHPSGTLVQGENSRDFPELDEPYEEINVVELEHRGFHYGWPYCYDFHATSPEWLFKDVKTAKAANADFLKQFKKPVDCELKNPQVPGEYQAPWALMPPHVAPLQMTYYTGPMFQDLFGGQLLVGWHGYQPTGSRIVAYPVDDRGRPRTETLTDQATYKMDRTAACPVVRKFQPNNGVDRIAPYREVISGWGEVKGQRPKGAPVGFTVADDGSIWIVEDRDVRSVVRLAKTSSANFRDNCEQTQAQAVDPNVNLLVWRNIVSSNESIRQGYEGVRDNLIQKNCLGCHGNMIADDIGKDAYSQLDFIGKNGWFNPGRSAESKIYGAISHGESYTPMPPQDKPQFYGTAAGTELIKSVGKWIDSLPTDSDSRVARTITTSARNIRNTPNGTVCGQFQANDAVYVDPRPAMLQTASGFVWARVYMLPKHIRLAPGKCAQPIDGSFWVAIRATAESTSALPVFNTK